MYETNQTVPPTVHGNSPMFNYRDGIWNHGEGFHPTGGSSIDYGGWRNLDDGSGVTLADVHAYPYAPGTGLLGWHSHTYVEPISPASGQVMKRFVGFLRPAGVSMLTGSDHPDPLVRQYNPTVPWVDNGAFEVFAPNQARNGRQVILVVGILATFGILNTPNQPRLTYPGIHSPDGLVRSPTDPQLWGQNTGHSEGQILRAASEFVIGRWQLTPTQTYYPIVAAGVPLIGSRPTELVQQRVMQLIAGARAMLGSAAFVPPQFGEPIADPNSIKVVLIGGSNGGHQALWALQDHQDKIHGVFAATINPSIQRLYSEQEVAYTMGRLAGSRLSGAQLSAHESRDWQHYVWQRGRSIRDFSAPAQALLGNLVRPICCYIGDEDVTSTGTDWVRLLTGSTYPNSGSGETGGVPAFKFVVADKRCHDGGWVNVPYSPSFIPTPSTRYEHELLFDVVAAVAAAPITSPPPVPALGAPLSFDRDIDDPSEWVFARQWATPPTGGALTEDMTFFDSAQPGWAGTQLGRQESMLITGGRIYVGGTEGVVTAFEVDPTDPVRKPLRVVTRATPRLGSTLQQAGDPLGHNAFGIVKQGAGFVVGTRRHLIRLDANLVETSRVGISWERAKPYRLRVADVFSQWPGSEIVCKSDHGGLLVYREDLSQSFEYKEPGIVDVLATGVTYASASTSSKSALTLLSERGVMANITLHTPGSSPPLGYMAELQAASAPFQDKPVDVEVQKVGGAQYLVGVFFRTGNPDNYVLRSYEPSTLGLVWERAHPMPAVGGALSGEMDLATVQAVDIGNDDSVAGDHIVLLVNDALQFHDHLGNQMFLRPLADYLPARQATAIAVGELQSGGPSGPYTQEIAVATQIGHVVWFHANELQASMPATLQVGLGVQPRTNQALSCTWCIAERGGNLNVLDQSGVLWQVTPTGVATVLDSNLFAAETRGWADVPVPGGPTSPGTFQWTPLVGPGSVTGTVSLRAWQPKFGKLVVYEPWFPGNSSHPAWLHWQSLETSYRFLDNFLLFGRGGGAAPLIGGGYEAHAWVESGWGNQLQGIEVHPDGALSPPHRIVQAWSSTSVSSGPQPPMQNNPSFLDLRNVEGGFAYEEFACVQPFTIGATRFVAIGSPGSRVRIIKSGLSSSPAHGHLVATSEDFGHGAAAMAVQVNGAVADIFVGTAITHTPRGGYPNAALSDSELLYGSIHWLLPAL